MRSRDRYDDQHFNQPKDNKMKKILIAIMLLAGNAYGAAGWTTKATITCSAITNAYTALATLSNNAGPIMILNGCDQPISIKDMTTGDEMVLTTSQSSIGLPIGKQGSAYTTLWQMKYTGSVPTTGLLQIIQLR